MTTEQSSDEGGEGLHVVSAYDNGIGLVWSCTCRATGAGASVRVVNAALGHARQSAEAALDAARREVEGLRAERDEWRDWLGTEAVLRGEIRRTESALSTFDDVVAERDDLRGRLPAVEALADDNEAWAWTAPVGPGNASYANGYESGRRSLAAEIRAALANPPAVQREGEGA